MNAFLKQASEKRDEMTRDLHVRYPRLLRPGFPRWTSQYGPGWFRLVDEFFSRVDRLLSGDQAARFLLEEIGQKFGAMRIRYRELGAAPDAPEPPYIEIHLIKLDVDARSKSTCFYCGSDGEPRRGGVMRVSCDACEAKLQPQL